MVVVTNHYILIFFCICKIIINNCLYVHFAFITVVFALNRFFLTSGVLIGELMHYLRIRDNKD